MKLTRGLGHNRKNLSDFSRTTPWKKANQIRIARDVDLSRPKPLDHRMANEDRAQSALVVEIGFERKNAEHQIEPARHFPDPPTVPRPDLRADVVNNFLRGQLLPKRAREAQIESRIVYQHDCVRLARFNFAQRFVKLFSKITVMLDHFPKSEHAGSSDPIPKISTGHGLHLRSAATDESKIDIGIAQCAHQSRSVIIRARLARNEVNGLQMKFETSTKFKTRML